MQTLNYFRYTLFASVVLAFTVVLLGAYTRLADAGLGCPDWPGCYGQLSVPHAHTDKTVLAARFPEAAPFSASKAWPEMIHRYFAGGLGLLIFSITAWACWLSKNKRLIMRNSYWTLICLVIIQALFGMWTVTWKLHPLAVMPHLIGGMLITGNLWWCYLRTLANKPPPEHKPNLPSWLKHACLAGIGIISLQIILGGWTSANYAALICPDFPLCFGKILPQMNFKAGFIPLLGFSKSYAGGVLDSSARITIQMTHRFNAILTTSYLFWLASKFIRLPSQDNSAKYLGYSIIVITCIQILVGAANIWSTLALPIAVAHNGLALLLVLMIITATYISSICLTTQKTDELCY